MATRRTVDHTAQSSCDKLKSHPTLCSRLVPLSSAISASLQCTQNISHIQNSSCMTIIVTSCISLARELFTCRRGAFVAFLEAILARGTTLNLPQGACSKNNSTKCKMYTDIKRSAALAGDVTHGAMTLVTHLSMVKKIIMSMRSSMTPTAGQAIVRLMRAVICGNAEHLSSTSMIKL